MAVRFQSRCCLLVVVSIRSRRCLSSPCFLLLFQRVQTHSCFSVMFVGLGLGRRKTPRWYTVRFEARFDLTEDLPSSRKNFVTLFGVSRLTVCLLKSS